MALTALAGCQGVLDDDPTSLGEPDQRRGDVIHPTHGDAFPDFSVPDPVRGDSVARDALLEDGPFVMTFIFTSCQDRCGDLMGILSVIQHDAIEEGWDDDVHLLAMTWDPETDDGETLRSYGEAHGIDVDHDHFHFLRPESEDDAIHLIDEDFGVPVHHGSGNGHDHDDHGPDGPVHYYMIFIVNEDGIVERSYPGPILFDHTPNDIVEDVRTVVN